MSDLTERLRVQYEYLRWYLPAEGDSAGDHELAVDTLAALDALDAAEAEIARLEHQLEQAEEAARLAYKDAEAAEAKLAAIDALHQPITTQDDYDEWNFVQCQECPEWPCDTHGILHPEEEQ